MDEPMYIAYVNDKLFVITDIYKMNSSFNFPGIRILSEASYSVEKVISKLIRKDEWKGVIYLSNSPKRSWEEFVSNFKLQEAAGGLVRNEKDEYLVIFRKGKWDLPKGKIDYDESPEQAAIREVKEECGIENLEKLCSLNVTFHTYLHNDKPILKKTHWFLMKGNSEEALKPQVEEDIEKVEWMSEQNIKIVLYSNTYSSILNLLKFYFDNRTSFKADKT